MTSWPASVRYALRALGKRPLYALVSVAVLAIAIGANTTVFSVLRAFLLRPLPYPEGDRLVVVYDSYPKLGLEYAGTAIPDYIERRAGASSLEDLGIINVSSRALGGDGPPEQIAVARASPSLFHVLGVAPIMGRLFDELETQVGSDRVAILSYDLWTTRFGARSDIVGRDVRLDGENLRVIGVLPRSFSFALGGRGADVWVPFAFTAAQKTNAERGRQFSTSVGRLRPGATLEGLNAELAAIVQRNIANGDFARAAFEETGFTGKARPLRDFQVGDLESMLLILQGTVLAVLLIACANLANLQLARVAERRNELLMRAALGAGSGQLIRLVLVESLTLAVLGAAAGVALAQGGLALVRALGLERSAQGYGFALDLPVIGVTSCAAVLAAVLSGLPPVLLLLRDGLGRGVQESGRLRGGRAAHTLRAMLVVAQIGLSVALLAAAGWLTKSYFVLQQEGAGFHAAGVWTAQINLPRRRYTRPESWPVFERQALEKLAALPGVSAAGFTSSLPFAGDNNQGSIVIADAAADGAPPPHAQSWVISDGFLTSLGIQVIAGRNFHATESERVAIVDENLAAKYWPGGGALGQRLRAATDGADEWYTVVGVVPAVKQASLAEVPLKDTVYWHYSQRPMNGGAFAVRTTLPPEQLTRAATAAIRSLDADIAVFDVQPMDARIARSLGPQRTPMVLTTVFAAVAFALAVIGVFAVLSWTVAQRAGEIGVRVALGARADDIVGMVVREGGRLIAIGIGVGAACALPLGVTLASQLRGVGAFDPFVLGGSALGLGAAALLASWLPARRAALIDPLQALRAD